MSDKLQAREWLINGGAGHEDGADGLRASMWSSEAVIEALDDYREYLLEAALTPAAATPAPQFHCSVCNDTIPHSHFTMPPQPVQPASASPRKQLEKWADDLAHVEPADNANRKKLLKVQREMEKYAALAAQPGVREGELSATDEFMRDYQKWLSTAYEHRFDSGLALAHITDKLRLALLRSKESA